MKENEYQSLDDIKDEDIYDLMNVPRYKTIDEYYRIFSDKIIEFNKVRPLQFYYAYPFDWLSLLTPIEVYAWTIIRSLGRIVLYPQFPVLNYRLDFGNPVLKIGLECDGKAYHVKEKDIIRDEKLWNEGWRIFRVSGSELWRDAKLEYENADETAYTDESLSEYYLNTAEGVVEAIRSRYFTKEEEYSDSRLSGLIYSTLDKHRLTQFPL